MAGANGNKRNSNARRRVRKLSPREQLELKKKLRKNRIASTVMAIFIVICIIIGCSPTTRNAIRNSTPKEIKYEKFLKMIE